jgi:hypothetical protein
VDGLDEQAVLGLAGHDYGPGVAAPPHAPGRVKAEATLGLVGSVALQPAANQPPQRQAPVLDNGPLPAYPARCGGALCLRLPAIIPPLLGHGTSIASGPVFGLHFTPARGHLGICH